MAASLDVIDDRGDALALERWDNTVALSVDGMERQYLQVIFLTPEQARTVAAGLLRSVAEIEAPDAPPDEVL